MQLNKDAWRPIETAPTDGTKVDLWVEESHSPAHSGRHVNCHYENGSWVEWIETQGGEWVDIEDDEFGIKATHWMYPPAPPE